MTRREASEMFEDMRGIRESGLGLFFAVLQYLAGQKGGGVSRRKVIRLLGGDKVFAGRVFDWFDSALAERELDKRRWQALHEKARESK